MLHPMGFENVMTEAREFVTWCRDSVLLRLGMCEKMLLSDE